MTHEAMTISSRAWNWPSVPSCVAMTVMAAGLGREVLEVDDGIAGDGNCTLREAIKAANLNVAVDQCDRVLVVQSHPGGQDFPMPGQELGVLSHGHYGATRLS